MAQPAGQTCSTCLYFLQLPHGDQEGKGICRFDPPKRADNKVEPNTADGRWPLCFAAEWCGSWKKP